MKRIIAFLFVISLCQFAAFGQKKYEMVVEKTDGSETVFNVEDIAHTYFRERNDGGGGGGGVNPGGGGDIVNYTSCPDANHPHLIDLSLPSGTKWACCNVGATTPEGYGEYYRWGETTPFNRLETYQYRHDWDGNGYYDENEYDNLGDNIAGTQYDAATANWGAPWRMPTEEQIDEVIANCTYTWTTQNGVNGGKVTGPNGGTIFLPASGRRAPGNGALDDVGSRGYYWSAAPNGGNSVRNLYFNSGHWTWDDYGRTWGFPVRAVAE